MSRGARIGKRAPTTVQIGLRLLLIAILVRIVFMSNALLALDLSNGSPAWSVNRLEAFGNGTPPRLFWVLAGLALIPIALIARFLARRGSKAGALVVAAYCLFRLGRMLFGSTLVDVMSLPSQVVIAALYVGTLACLASPSSRAWFRGQIQSD